MYPFFYVIIQKYCTPNNFSGIFFCPKFAFYAKLNKRITAFLCFLLTPIRKFFVLQAVIPR